MTQVEKNSIKPGDITKYYIGSILSGGGGSPSENTPQAWYAMIEGFQNEALGTRLKIPIIYGVDAVHGHGNLRNATIFPHNIGLGAANDPALIEKIGTRDCRRDARYWYPLELRSGSSSCAGCALGSHV